MDFKLKRKGPHLQHKLVLALGHDLVHKVTRTQEEVRSEKVDVKCGKNLVRIITKG